MYFRNTKVYFQSTKVYSRSTKVYSPSTKVYFQSTSILSNYASILSKNKSILWKYKSILWRKNPKTRLLRVLFDSIDLLALFGVYAGIIIWESILAGAMWILGSVNVRSRSQPIPKLLYYDLILCQSVNIIGTWRNAPATSQDGSLSDRTRATLASLT